LSVEKRVVEWHKGTGQRGHGRLQQRGCEERVDPLLDLTIGGHQGGVAVRARQAPVKRGSRVRRRAVLATIYEIYQENARNLNQKRLTDLTKGVAVHGRETSGEGGGRKRGR
jgi:hypothetical protein